MIGRRVNDHILPSGAAECRYLFVSPQRWVVSAADVHQGMRMRLALAASGTLVHDSPSNSGQVVRRPRVHRTPACPIAALPIRPGLRRTPAKPTLLRGYPVVFSATLLHPQQSAATWSYRRRPNTLMRAFIAGRSVLPCLDPRIASCMPNHQNQIRTFAARRQDQCPPPLRWWINPLVNLLRVSKPALDQTEPTNLDHVWRPSAHLADATRDDPERTCCGCRD